MPYLVPTWALSTIGISTMTLARKIVRTACHQFIPSSISDEASMYVGMQADIEIQNAASSRRPHLRSDSGVGARSSFSYAEAATSTGGSVVTCSSNSLIGSLSLPLELVRGAGQLVNLLGLVKSLVLGVDERQRPRRQHAQ